VTPDDTPAETARETHWSMCGELLCEACNGTMYCSKCVERSRAALDALMEWREAEEAWEGCRLVQGAAVFQPIAERRKAATAALRSAADSLRRAREGGGG
jgi:hypothetical protein